MFGKRRKPDFFELTCPICGHHQRESSMVVSTNCRGCSVYLKIDGTKITVPSLSSSSPRYQATSSIPDDPNPANAPMARSEASLPKPEREPEPTKKSPAAKGNSPSNQKVPSPPRKVAEPQTQHEEKPEPTGGPNKPTRPSAESAAVKTFQKIINSPKSEEPSKNVRQPDPRNAPSSPLAKKPIKPKAPPPPAKPDHTGEEQPIELAELQSNRYRPAASPKEETTHRSLINREKKRSVICFECHHSHEILADSTSALCPTCGAYIGLKNYDIRDQVNSRIQTRGNVFVHKKGSITGITIQCHNLIIEGDIKGGAECSGDFIIRKNGKINGPVTSDRVVIERRAVVDFMSTVKAREIIIDGEVTGSVSCKKLVLKKRATLDGDLEVGALSIEDGARHTGNIRMTGS